MKKPATKSTGHGGARKGAGRPKSKETKALQQKKARKMFNLAIDGMWDKLMDALDYHVSKGDKEMVKYAINQRIGKPLQAADLTTDGDKIQGIVYLPPRK